MRKRSKKDRPLTDHDIDALLEAIGDKDDSIRTRGIRRLSAAKTLPDRMVPPLTLVLLDPLAEVRIHAADSLRHIKADKSMAIPNLLGMLREEDKDIRRAALRAFSSFRRLPLETVPDLVRAANEKDVQIHKLGKRNLLQLPSSTIGLVENVIEALYDFETQVRILTLSTLGKLRPKDVGSLIKTLPPSSPHTRTQARTILQQISSQASLVVKRLCNRLNKDDTIIQREAAIALGQLGREAKDAVDALTERLSDVHQDVRTPIIKALGCIGLEARPAVKPLTQILKQNEPTVIMQVVASLRNIGYTPPETVSVLVETFAVLDVPSDVEAVTELLVQIGEDAKEGLTDALENHQHPRVLRGVIVILSRFRTIDKSIVPHLLEKIKRQDLAQVSLEALDKLDRASWLPQLMDKLKGSNRQGQELIVEHLKQHRPALANEVLTDLWGRGLARMAPLSEEQLEQLKMLVTVGYVLRDLNKEETFTGKNEWEIAFRTVYDTLSPTKDKKRLPTKLQLLPKEHPLYKKDWITTTPRITDWLKNRTGPLRKLLVNYFTTYPTEAIKEEQQRGNSKLDLIVEKSETEDIGGKQAHYRVTRFFWIAHKEAEDYWHTTYLDLEGHFA